MTAATAIVWFRHDLRLADQPALRAAIRRGGPVLPLFIWSPEEEGRWSSGAATRWWLHQSLTQLDAALCARGSRLVIRQGPALEVLRQLASEAGATAVYWNRRYEPAIVERDRSVKESLRSGGIEAESFNGSLLFEPWDIQTNSGGCYQVFTPFWRRCCELGIERESLPKPRELVPMTRWPAGLSIAELRLLPTIPWDRGFYDRWTPGEAGAQQALQSFMKSAIEEYHEQRDRPATGGTSSLSPHLHFGEISPLQIWEAVTARFGPPMPAKKGPKSGPMTFLTEVGWREFAHHVMYHFPHTPEAPLREKFVTFPWEETPSQLRAWQRGLTGYPIVDAGMRELWATGWMHNRVRMIVGSFLTKDLLLSWQQGADWFWDTLVDADLANNTLGWQWISGCGADAAPYFRIFNPVSQGEKFDPAGSYVRRWVPELARLPDQFIHRPWEAPPTVLASAALSLGIDYPRPLVDHAAARERALAALGKLKL